RDHHNPAKDSIDAEEQPWQDGKTERARHHRGQERSKRLLAAFPQGCSAYAVEGHGGEHQEHKDQLRDGNRLAAQESCRKRPYVPLTPVSVGPLETGITVDALAILVPTIETAGLAHFGLDHAHFGWSKARQ